MTYAVQVSHVRLRFMCAHMATYNNATEALHGHNYLVTAQVEGQPTADAWVIDFSALKRAVRERCEFLDHHMLLQRDSRVLAITQDADGWVIGTPAGATYRFPLADVVALPVENTTAEQLARWFHGEVAAELRAAGWNNLTSLRIDVEEAPGQSAWYAAPLDYPVSPPARRIP